MQWRRLLKVVVFVTGACGAGAALLLLALALAAWGRIVQGQTGLCLTAVGMLLFATPMMAFPFSRRVAKAALMLALAALAGVALWMSFLPQDGVASQPWVQAGAIAFAVLLVVRVHLGRRRERPSGH